jgi:hypothetical protein
VDFLSFAAGRDGALLEHAAPTTPSFDMHARARCRVGLSDCGHSLWVVYEAFESEDEGLWTRVADFFLRPSELALLAKVVAGESCTIPFPTRRKLWSKVEVTLLAARLPFPDLSMDKCCVRRTGWWRFVDRAECGACSRHEGTWQFMQTKGSELFRYGKRLKRCVRLCP